jgi:hypothetical protein
MAVEGTSFRGLLIIGKKEGNKGRKKGWRETRRESVWL